MKEKYLILKAKTSEELQYEVEKKLRNGWSLTGGLSVEKGVFYQAVVK